MKTKNFFLNLFFFLSILNFAQNRIIDIANSIPYNNYFYFICDSSQQLVRYNNLISPIASNAKYIHSSDEHMLLLKTDSTVYAMGSNTYGQLGNGNNNSSNNAFVKVQGIGSIVEISASDKLSAALDVNGNVWVWGMNAQQIAGNGTGDSNYPLKINSVSNIKHISASYKSFFLLKNDSTAWYVDSIGTLKKIGNLNQIIQIEALDYIPMVACLKLDGTVYVWGNNPLPTPISYYGDGRIRTISDTLVHTVLINNVKQILAIRNNIGSFGVTPSNVVVKEHFCAIKNDNTIWIWGGSIQNVACYGKTNCPFTWKFINFLPLVPTLRKIQNNNINFKGLSFDGNNIDGNNIFIIDSNNSLFKENCPARSSLSDTSYIIKEFQMIYSNPCAVAGISEWTVAKENLLVYPNPVSNELNIEIQSQNEHIQKIIIQDIMGKILMSKDYPKQKILHIENINWEEGIYLIKVETNENNYIKKIIIKK
jgi:hypothetical protein